MKKRLKLIFPKKSDYPNNLRVLDRPGQSAEYHQLIEAAASAYFETDRLTRWLFMQRFKIAVKLIEKNPRGDYLLDAGTGIGFFLPILSQAAKKVYAIDNTDYSLRYARKMCQKLKIKNVVLQQASIESPPFIKNKFHTIVCLSVLEHIQPDKLPVVVKNFKKILKPGGRLIAGYPNEGSYLFKWLKNLERICFRFRIFKAFNDQARGKFKTFGHVATAKQINQVITSQLTKIDEQNLPVPGIKLYSIGLFVKKLIK